MNRHIKLKVSLLGAALLLLGSTTAPGTDGLFAAEKATHNVIGVFGTTSS